MRIRLLLVVLTMTVLVLPVEAGAAPGWRPPVAVETSPSAAALSFPKIAARPDGCTTVAFERSDVVYASTRPPSGFFSPIQNLGSILPTPSPEIAVGGGIAAAAWPNPSSRIQVASAANCEPLGVPAEVPGSYTLANQGAEIAVDSAGKALVAFEAGGSGSRRIYIAERPAAGAPTEADDIAPPAGTEAFRPKLATNGGSAGIVFDVVQSGSQVYGARRLGAGSWSAPVRLNEEGKPAVAGSAEAAIGPDGTLYCVWIDTGVKKAILATLDPGGTVTRTTLIEAGGTLRDPAIAVDAEGRLAIAWAEEIAIGQARIHGKHREPGGSLSQQRNVSATTNIGRGAPWVEIDADGRTIVAWAQQASPPMAVQITVASIRSPGSEFFGGEVPISQTSQVTSPSGIDTDADGNTLVALFMTETPREAKVAAFDAAGPLPSDLVVPSGQAGASLPFSVSAVDAWSSPVTAQWQFGDGAGADGFAVTHSYAAAGSFGVTATVADALGNASQTSGTATVAPAPAAASPVAGGAGPLAGGAGAAGKDVIPPRLSKLRFSPASFSVGGGKAPRISFKLSEPAAVRFTVKPGGRSFQRRARAGRNRLRLPARLRSLSAGVYRLRAVATDAAGNRSKARTARFTALPLA